MDATLSLVSGGLFIVGYVPYVRAILLRRTVPTRSTWIVWCVINVIAVVTMSIEGALNPQIVAATCGALTVAVLSFFHGDPGWSALDKACLAGAAVGIALWLALGDPVLALVASQAAGLVGSLPLIASAWRDPAREDPLGLALFGASSLCMLLALDEWTLVKALQPVQIAFVTLLVNVILHVRPKSRRA